MFKASLKSVLGALIIIVALTYCGLLVYCAVTRNDTGLSMFGGGFVAFAQQLISKFADAELTQHLEDGQPPVTPKV